jgi:hypothetical protein
LAQIFTSNIPQRRRQRWENFLRNSCSQVGTWRRLIVMLVMVGIICIATAVIIAAAYTAAAATVLGIAGFILFSIAPFLFHDLLFVPPTPPADSVGREERWRAG